MKSRARTALAAGLLAGGIAGGSTLAIAVGSEPTPRESTVIKVCVGKKSTVVSATKSGKCPAGSKRTVISQTGPVGPAGPPGAPGPASTTGPTSDPGPVIDGGAP